MEENKSCTDGRCKCVSSLVPLLAGLIVALAFGWWVFPDLMFSKQPQPVFFDHSVHTDKLRMDCVSCHYLREDGSYSGAPVLAQCTPCHNKEVLTKKPGPNAPEIQVARFEAEKNFLEEFVWKGREPEWVIHQFQPDNAFFSHAAHLQKCYACHLTMKEERINLGTPENMTKLCQQCHPSLEKLDASRGVEKNILSGYSRTTMKMWQCESCHAHPGHYYNGGAGRTAANNACFTCHK